MLLNGQYAACYNKATVLRRCWIVVVSRTQRRLAAGSGAAASDAPGRASRSGTSATSGKHKFGMLPSARQRICFLNKKKERKKKKKERKRQSKLPGSKPRAAVGHLGSTAWTHAEDPLRGACSWTSFCSNSVSAASSTGCCKTVKEKEEGRRKKKIERKTEKQGRVQKADIQKSW